jgi:modulator of FtsH protease HflK
MPWNNQGGGGGGPWGTPPGGGDRGNGGGNGGGGNPWGGRPPGGGGGGGGQTPDIEELVSRAQAALRRKFPGGFGGGRGIAFAAGALAVVWLGTGIYRVGADEQGVVLRFGEWVRTEQPGLRYHLPAPIEAVYLPKVTRVNRIEVGYRSTGTGDTRRADRDVPDESAMLTGDENIIDIDFSVFWVIKDAGHFLFKIRDPETTVKKAAESAMREVIGRTELQPALTEARQQIEAQTKALLQAMLDDYETGVEVTQVQLQKADPPAPVIDAFNDVQRARSDRERLRNEAESYRNDVIPRARGEAERLHQEASAYREQVVSLATGDAQRFTKIYQAYNLSKDVVARRMYLETMEEILKGVPKVIIGTEGVGTGAGDGKSSGGSGVVPYLPLNQLIPNWATGGDAKPAPRQ